MNFRRFYVTAAYLQIGVCVQMCVCVAEGGLRRQPTYWRAPRAGVGWRRSRGSLATLGVIGLLEVGRARPSSGRVEISRRSGAPTVLERTPSPELASSDRARSVLARRRARTLPGAELLALWSPLATFVAAGSPWAGLVSKIKTPARMLCVRAHTSHVREAVDPLIPDEYWESSLKP